MQEEGGILTAHNGTERTMTCIAALHCCVHRVVVRWMLGKRAMRIMGPICQGANEMYVHVEINTAKRSMQLTAARRMLLRRLELPLGR